MDQLVSHVVPVFMLVLGPRCHPELRGFLLGLIPRAGSMMGALREEEI